MNGNDSGLPSIMLKSCGWPLDKKTLASSSGSLSFTLADLGLELVNIYSEGPRVHTPHHTFKGIVLSYSQCLPILLCLIKVRSVSCGVLVIDACPTRLSRTVLESFVTMLCLI